MIAEDDFDYMDDDIDYSRVSLIKHNNIFKYLYITMILLCMLMYVVINILFSTYTYTISSNINNVTCINKTIKFDREIQYDSHLLIYSTPILTVLVLSMSYMLTCCDIYILALKIFLFIPVVVSFNININQCNVENNKFHVITILTYLMDVIMMTLLFIKLIRDERLHESEYESELL